MLFAPNLTDFFASAIINDAHNLLSIVNNLKSLCSACQVASTLPSQVCLQAAAEGQATQPFNTENRNNQAHFVAYKT